MKCVCFAVHKSSNFNCTLVSKIDNYMRSMSCSKKRKILQKGGCLMTRGLLSILLFNKMNGLFANLPK